MTRLAWGALMLWLVVVVAGSGLAWVAIDEAGRSVGSSEPTTAAPLPTASATRRPSTTPSTTRTPAPSHTRTPSTPTRTRPAAPERVRTWSGTPGSVTVACRGSVASLRSATPADGWRAEREDDVPGVQVKFEGSENSILVGATCDSGGVPRFRVVADE